MVDNKKVFVNLIWRFLERCGAQGVTFIVSIILARLLDPTVYGTVALVTVFTTVLHVFVDSGLGNALIQKKDADDLDFSSVFYFNIVVCCILYAGMFLAAPFIANFYNLPELTSIVRVVSLTLIISGVKNVQQAYVSRHLMFKRFFWATLGGTIGAAVIGILLAYMGFGVWALVVQSLFNMVVDTLILWMTVKWRPKLMFSFNRLKALFSFGWKLLVSSLVDTLYQEIRQLIIGKVYTASDLAYYNRGNQFPNLIVTNINSSINSVLLPVMSSAQDNRENICAMTRRAIQISTYIMAPLMIGLAVCAEPLVRLVLTEKWLPCVPYLQVFCIIYGFYPIHTANLNAIKAMGRSDIFLKLEVLKNIIGLIVLVSTMWISVEAMLYGIVFVTITSSVINAFPNKKLLGYSYIRQLLDMMPAILLSLVMGFVVWCVSFFNIGDIWILIIQVLLGALIYIVSSKLMHFKSFEYLLSIFKGLIFKHNKN